MGDLISAAAELKPVRGASSGAALAFPPIRMSIETRRAEFDHKAERFVTWLNKQYEQHGMNGDVREWMDDLRRELYEHYRVWVNPLYRPLIDSIVELDGMCRQLFSNAAVLMDETHINHDRYYRWRLLQLHFIRQLQRHTEALTFSVRQYKDEADKLLQIVWRALSDKLAPEQQTEVFEYLLDAVQVGMQPQAPLRALAAGQQRGDVLEGGKGMGTYVLPPWETVGAIYESPHSSEDDQ